MQSSECELKLKAEQDSFVSNQSQRSAGSTFSGHERDKFSSEHHWLNSNMSAHSFELPRPNGLSMPPALIRNSNSVTALHKHQKSELSDLDIQRAQSNEFKVIKNSGTAGATGSSIHFTLEENSFT